MGKSGKKPYEPKAPKWNGDQGTETVAAKKGTIIERMDGPNRVGRRRRQLQSEKFEKKHGLSMRQLQAAQAIEKAYARCEAQGSGGDSIGKVIALQTTVDSSPKPDAVVDMQAGAISHLRNVMKPVPSAMRDVIEHLFWHNRPMGQLAQGRAFYDRAADVKVALDLVANHLRY